MDTDVRDYALKVIANAVAMANELGRSEIADQLAARGKQVSEPSRRVVVCGGFKQGKTSLLNSLLNGRLAPSDPVEPTAVPLSVIYGEPAAGVFLTDSDGLRFAPIEVKDLSDVLLGKIREAEGSPITGVSARFPRKILQEGLIFVDTPPVNGGLASPAAITVLGEIQRAAAFVFTSDASQELTAPELQFIQAATRLCPTVVCCQTKSDLYKDWPRIMHLSEGHLRKAGVDTMVLPVSSTLRQRGIAMNDPDLIRQSGYEFLSEFLRHRVLGESLRRTLLAAADDVKLAAAQLLEPLAAELAALQQPEDLGELRSRAAEAQANVEAFSNDRGWERVLSRELQRIRDDSQFNLRVKLAELERWAVERIDTDDPEKFWSDFEGRLHRETTQAVVDQLAYIRAAAAEAVERVAEAVQRDAEELDIELDDFRIPFSASALELEDDVFRGRLRGVQTGVVAARFGGAAGIAAFGALNLVTGGLAAVALGASAALASGFVFARVGREGGIERRRQEAKAALRRYLTDLRLVVDKASSDAVTQTQQQLIEGFEALVTGLKEGRALELDALTEAERRSEAERPARIAEISGQGDRLKLIYQHAQRVAEASQR